MPKNKFDDHYQYSGAIHMHTDKSDGTKSLEEIISIGQETGLDFMMITDHMGMENRELGGEGLYNKTLVLIGYEHNDLDDNHHYLIFESPKVYDESLSAKEYVKQAHDDGSFGIIAHPDEIRPRTGKYPPYPWIDWNVEGYDGIELWNQMSEWMEKLTKWNQVALAFSPRKSMVGPPQTLLDRWDKLSRKRKIVGIFAVDAHAFPIKLGPLTVEIFPYKVHFRSLRTHILLNEPMSSDFETAKNQLYSALKDCRVFGSNMRWGKADGFQFNASTSAEKTTIGGSISTVDNCNLEIQVPSKADIKIIGNGEQLLSAVSKEVTFKPQEEGVYRVEVWKGSRGWIFSNHIRIGV